MLNPTPTHTFTIKLVLSLSSSNQTTLPYSTYTKPEVYCRNVILQPICFSEKIHEVGNLPLIGYVFQLSSMHRGINQTSAAPQMQVCKNLDFFHLHP